MIGRAILLLAAPFLAAHDLATLGRYIRRAERSHASTVDRVTAAMLQWPAAVFAASIVLATLALLGAYAAILAALFAAAS